MVKIAIAGGSGALGKTILDVLQHNLNHEAVVLGRKQSQSPASVELIEIDYNDTADIQAQLEKESIEVVVATFHMSQGALQAQLNLIEAASHSRPTKRFIPTSFAIPYPAEAASELKPLQLYFEAISALRKSDLEWTLVHNGLFLDYFAMPHIRTHLAPNVIAVDIPNQIAAIPGNGDVPITFTYTYDAAKFVIAALDLPKWSEESTICGDVVTWNEFVDLAEEVLGVRFKRIYDSVEKLQAFEVTELPGHVPLYDKVSKSSLQWFLALFELWTTDGRSHVKRNGSLNEMFPDIKPLKVRDMIEMYWKPKT